MVGLGGAAVFVLATRQLGDGGAEPWAKPDAESSLQISHGGFSTAGTLPAVKDKMSGLLLNFRKLDILVGAIWLCFGDFRRRSG
jgi:hypothetical protein